MQETLDIGTITDLDKLKAMAYDEIANRERADHNLNLINQRITMLESLPKDTPATEAPDPNAVPEGSSPEPTDVPAAESKA